MSTTGFKLSDGKDLIELFETYTTGTQADPTGFKVSSGADLNTVFAKNTSGTYIANNTSYIAQPGQDLRLLFEPVAPLAITIEGTGTVQNESSGTRYQYRFTAGSNTIRINKNITNMYVIAVGGGGPAGNGYLYGNGTLHGGGGGGSGWGVWQFVYTKNSQYITTVGGITNCPPPGNGASPNGSNTEFKDTSGVGIIARGGSSGMSFAQSPGPIGTLSKNVTTSSLPGTLTTRYGGQGGYYGGNNGGDTSSGQITVLAISYNYGGGGGRGSEFPSAWGSPGSNGTGGRAAAVYSSAQASASTPGSGGGGGPRDHTYYNGGNGARGEVVVIFQYP